MKIDEIKFDFEQSQQPDKDCIEIVKKYSVEFCNYILSITDEELKKEKDPQILFNKYLESL